MELDEAKEKKNKLETGIKNLIDKFHSETGLFVNGIDLDTTKMYADDEVLKPIVVVKVNVSL